MTGNCMRLQKENWLKKMEIYAGVCRCKIRGSVVDFDQN